MSETSRAPSRGPSTHAEPLSFLEELHEAKRARIEAARESLYRQHASRSPVVWDLRAASAPPRESATRHRRPGSSTSSNILFKASEPTSPGQLMVAKATDDDFGEDFMKTVGTAVREVESWSARTPSELTEYLRASILPISASLDPFASMPTQLDPLREELILFYLQIYPRTAYGLSDRMQPAPIAKSFAVGLTSPGAFHVILARSALHRLSLALYSSDEERRSLEVAALKHKGEAIRIIRALSGGQRPASADDLLAATVCMGMLGRRYGPPDSADMHLEAARRIVRQHGGPLHIENSTFEHIALCFECSLSISKTSLIWDSTDFSAKLSQLNNFLTHLRRVWQYAQASSAIKPSASSVRPQLLPFLRPSSILYPWLTRETVGRRGSIYKDIQEINHQLTCILILASVFVEKYREPALAFEYKIEVESKVRNAHLDPEAGFGVLNIAYIMQDIDCCLRSDKFRQLQWSVAGFLWVLRFVSDERTVLLRDWLLGFLEGRAAESSLQLSLFDFSYVG